MPGHPRLALLRRRKTWMPGTSFQAGHDELPTLCDTPIPDKVMSKPSLGRGTAGVSSILHDDLKSRAAAAG
jgi:hypothetical protein